MFRYVLAGQLDRLAPLLRRHYDVPPGHEVLVEGVMDAWNRLPWARPFAQFMSVPGQDQRVRVRNRGVLDAAGLSCYEWMRKFHTPAGLATSYTLTKPTPRTMPFRSVLDCFNQPQTIGLTLEVEVANAGQTLLMRSRGPQFLMAGATLVPLSDLFAVNSVVIERAVSGSDDRVATVVVISHPLPGKLFGYHGTLTVGNHALLLRLNWPAALSGAYRALLSTTPATP